MGKKLLILLLIFAFFVGMLGPVAAIAYTPGAHSRGGLQRESIPPAAEQRDFPSMHLTSDLHPFTQVREFWHPGLLTVESDNAAWAREDVAVRLRGRGNSTWWEGPDKRPLRVRFENPREQHMFDSEYAHRDWILLAHAFDNSLLRTQFAFDLAELMGTMGFVPSLQFVHLYVNGEYVGVYQFTDERDIGPGRGEVVLDPNPAISEYWLEMDNRTHDYFRVNGLWYDIRFPSGDALTRGHIDYAHEFIESVSRAIRSRDWDRVTQLVDIPSMVDYYILQELVKDGDVSWSSMFMQIRGQGDNRRLYQGPVWDFDLSMGNVRSNFIDERTDGLWAARAHYWFRGLMNIPEFRDLVVERWNELMEYEIPRAISNIEYFMTYYRDALERNFEAQPVLGIRWGTLPSPPRYQIDTFYGQVAFLLQWLDQRIAWLDYHLNLYPPIFPTFSDVREGAWYREAVDFVFINELMRGISPNLFAPHDSLNRAMTVAILWRLAGEPEVAWSPIFSDVPQNASAWFRTAVMWGHETGVITGAGGRFDPHGAISREQMAAMLHRFTQLILEGEVSTPEEFSLSGFRDVGDISPWAMPYMLWANYIGLIQGTNQGDLRPGGQTSRAEGAVILMRYAERFVMQEAMVLARVYN